MIGKTYRALNLDSMFQPLAYPEIEFNSFKFNGGEMSIKLNTKINYSLIDCVVITTRIKNGDDVMLLMLAVDALKRQGIKDIDLILPYFPYGRQDRVCNAGESFSLKVFTKLIDSMGFSGVYTLDNHSIMSTGLLENCYNSSNFELVLRTIKELDLGSDSFHLISIDAGASSKINKLADYLLENGVNNFDVIQCNKKRNVTNGKIEGFEVFSGDLNQIPCLIVDDICDGGASFIAAANALKEKNAGWLYLFVSHGIFSRGYNELAEHFKMIVSTNSFADDENWILKRIKLSW